MQNSLLSSLLCSAIDGFIVWIHLWHYTKEKKVINSAYSQGGKQFECIKCKATLKKINILGFFMSFYNLYIKWFPWHQEPKWPQWPQQSQQPQWPQWTWQPHLIKKLYFGEKQDLNVKTGDLKKYKIEFNFY